MNNFIAELSPEQTERERQMTRTRIQYRQTTLLRSASVGYVALRKHSFHRGCNVCPSTLSILVTTLSDVVSISQ